MVCPQWSTLIAFIESNRYCGQKLVRGRVIYLSTEIARDVEMLMLFLKSMYSPPCRQGSCDA
jgi:hypothetical protein